MFHYPIDEAGFVQRETGLFEEVGVEDALADRLFEDCGGVETVRAEGDGSAAFVGKVGGVGAVGGHGGGWCRDVREVSTFDVVVMRFVEVAWL